MKKLFWLSLFLVNISYNVIAATPVVQPGSLGSVGQIYASPAQKYSIAANVTVNRYYHTGDMLPVAEYRNLTRYGHRGLGFDAANIYVSHALFVHASDPQMIGDLEIEVVSTVDNFLGRACPRTLPVSVMRSNIESFWNGQASLVPTRDNLCHWNVTIDSDVIADLSEYLVENDGHLAFLQIGPRSWNIGDQLGIALGFLYEGGEYTDVLEEYRADLESIISDNEPMVDDLVWDHAANFHVSSTQNYTYPIPR